MKAKYQFLALLMLPLSALAQPFLNGNHQPQPTERLSLSKPLNLSANLENNRLSISGNFENGKLYEVIMFNTKGQRIYSRSFMGNSAEKRFDIAGNLISGEYTIAVKQKGAIG